MIWIWALFGCASELPEVTRAPMPFEDVTVTIGTDPEVLELQLAGAWIDDEGDGRGEAVSAALGGAPPLEIRGERSSWSLSDGVVVFEGEVQATRRDVSLRCDRLEVTYADERVASAVASGSVRVHHGNRRAEGQRAHLTVADGRIVLTGGAQIDDGPNRLVGEPITLFLDEERILCDQCTLVIDGAAVAPSRP